MALDAGSGAMKAGSRLERLTEHPAIEHRSALSLEGSRAAFARVTYSGEEVWVKDLTVRDAKPSDLYVSDRRIDVNSTFPVPSSDGSKLAYLKDGAWLWIHDSSSGESRRVGEHGVPRSWRPDGGGILTMHGGVVSHVDIGDDEEAKAVEILRHGEYPLFDPRFSPDGRWIAFSAETSSATSRIFVAPFRAGAATRAEEWIAVSDGESWDDRPYWSSDGGLVYFASNRDGFICIWARRFDAGAMTPDPAGPFEVLPLHEARLDFESYGGCWSFSVGPDRLLLTPLDGRANVWLTRLARPE